MFGEWHIRWQEKERVRKRLDGFLAGLDDDDRQYAEEIMAERFMERRRAYDAQACYQQGLLGRLAQGQRQADTPFYGMGIGSSLSAFGL